MEEDPWVPQSEIEKDQTYVQQFEKVEVEVTLTAHLQIVDNLIDEVDNTSNLAQAMLGSALAWLRLSDPKFVVHISFSLVQISWHTEFQLPRLTK